MIDLTAARQGPFVAASPLVRPMPPAARWIVRGDAAVMAAAARALELPFEPAVCRAAAADGRAVLWLGPDERLLLAPRDEAGRALADALAGLAHSLVEVSHRQCALEITGPYAETVLNSGCPLDLEASAFPVGMCTRTVFAKAQIVLWRTAQHSFHLEVWRSFCAYVSQLLALAGRELVR